jgi:hypothetical protein
MWKGEILGIIFGDYLQYSGYLFIRPYEHERERNNIY